MEMGLPEGGAQRPKSLSTLCCTVVCQSDEPNGSRRGKNYTVHGNAFPARFHHPKIKQALNSPKASRENRHGTASRLPAPPLPSVSNHADGEESTAEQGKAAVRGDVQQGGIKRRAGSLLT